MHVGRFCALIQCWYTFSFDHGMPAITDGMIRIVSGQSVADIAKNYVCFLTS